MPDLTKIFKDLPKLDLDLSKKKILFIYGVGVLTVLILYFHFLLRPSLAKVFTLIPDVRERTRDIKAISDDLLTENELKGKLKILHEKMEKYEKRLSREKELPVLLESLSEIARSSRVKILSITPIAGSAKDKKAPAEKETVYQEVPIAISAQGGYHELGAFINRVENDQRYMQVANVKISASKDNPMRHNIEFVVYAYTFKKE